MGVGIGEIPVVADAHHGDDLTLVVTPEQFGRHCILWRLPGACAEKDDGIRRLYIVQRVSARELAAHEDPVTNLVHE